MNLVPQKAKPSGGYWCTWRTAGEILPAERRGDPLLSRDGMGETFLFGPHGVGHPCFHRIKGDIFVLLDDGWDVPVGTPNPEMRWKFGSMELCEERFPSCVGTPEERLKKLCKMLRDQGFAGTGLWVAIQCRGERADFRVEEDSFTRYWEERARWCGTAGVDYWKVDWGEHCSEVRFRALLSEAAKRVAPRLKIEHAYPVLPWNREGNARRRRSYIREMNDQLAIAEISDYFRTYDVMDEFSKPTTLDRLSDLLLADLPKGGAVINIEDEPYIGAALGGSLGIMRHPNWPDHEDMPAGLHRRWNETERAVLWQRMAPPFGLGLVEEQASEERLNNFWHYNRNPEDWPYVGEETVVQSAPAVLSRNMPLPLVREPEGIPPHAVASVHPHTGACAVGTFARTFEGRFWELRRAEVEIEAAGAGAPVGIFGEYAALTIRFPENLEGRRVLLQDLLGNEAADVTGSVSLKENSVTLPGGLIHEAGTAAGSPGDISEPGCVLRVI